jgi:uncharacterized protein (TIGR03905 family)
MKQYTYYPQGTCSSRIDFIIDDEDVLRDVQFTDGCNGNLQGISALVRGMKVSDVIGKLQGIRCGYKNTSCPDQLATALREAMANGTK